MAPLAKTLATAAVVLAAPALAAASLIQRLEARQYQDPNSPLVINEPSCNFYQCIIYWEPGQQVAVNWINPPQGTVKIDLMANNNSDVVYTVGTAPAISNTCDAGAGYGQPGPNGAQCGGFVFTVPSLWNAGNYSGLRAMNVENENLQSFTDKIAITKNSTTSNDAALSIVSGSTVGGGSSAAAASSSTGSAAAATTTSGSAGPTGSASRSGGTASMTSSSSQASSTGQSGSNGAVGAMGSSATVLTVVAAVVAGLAGFL